MTSFAGKVVLITGAARGIGADTARRLARRGARVVLVGMEPERLMALAAELGDGHSWHYADVTDQRALDAAVAAAVAQHGGLDIVIANAGIASLGTVAVAEVEALVRVLDVNLAGVLRTVKATLPHVRARRGYYLLVSSAAAFSAMPGLSAYAASKAGVEQFGNVLRLELLADGVEVGTAHMTWIDTDMVRDATRDLSSFRRTLQRLPGPFGTVTSCDACAAAFEDACAGRRRRVFVPGSLRVASLLRPLLASRLLQWLLRRDLTPMLHDGEREMAAVGRAFGEHSVGMGPDRGAIPLSSDTPSVS